MLISELLGFAILPKNSTSIIVSPFFIHTATVIDDMDIPGWRFHSLKGDREGLWAVNVSGIWRVVFEFKDGHAYVVNYEDYH